MYKKDRSVNRIVTYEFLDKRIGSGKYGISAWIKYCTFMLNRGYKVELYEAKETVSKYITVYSGHDLSFKVRFSDHPPSKQRMVESDVKMVVGIGSHKLDEAIQHTLNWFDT